MATDVNVSTTGMLARERIALNAGIALRREGGTVFTLGVAVHTGEVFAGGVGSAKQRKYAVVGDPVNTVARLEELNRNLGTEIVLSGDALALVRDRVDVHPRGSFSLRGRSHAVEVFELLGVQHPSFPRELQRQHATGQCCAWTLGCNQ